MEGEKKWQGPRRAWNTTLRGLACVLIPLTIDIEQSANGKVKQNSAKGREESARILEATRVDTQCTLVTTHIGSLPGTRYRMADHLSATLGMDATHEREILAILKPGTRETCENVIHENPTGPVQAPTRAIAPLWSINARTPIIPLPRRRTRVTAPPTRLRPRTDTPRPRIRLLLRMRPQGPRSRMTLPTEPE